MAPINRENVLTPLAAAGGVLLYLNPRGLMRKLKPLNSKLSNAAMTLTPRERSVIVLRARGLPYKAICQKLGITLSTVKLHVGNVLRKTSTQSSAEAVFYLSENGQLPTLTASYSQDDSQRTIAQWPGQIIHG